VYVEMDKEENKRKVSFCFFFFFSHLINDQCPIERKREERKKDE
jgi:hypothetical protein